MCLSLHYTALQGSTLHYIIHRALSSIETVVNSLVALYLHTTNTLLAEVIVYGPFDYVALHKWYF